MSTKQHETAAIKAIDRWADEDERSETDWQTVALIHGLIAIAEAIDRTTHLP